MFVKNNPRKAWSQASYGFLSRKTLDAHTDMQTDQSAPQATSVRGGERILVWEGRGNICRQKNGSGGNDAVHKLFQEMC